MCDIDAQDCRLTGYSANRQFRVYEAEYLPTGLLLEFRNGLTKREAMQRLQNAVNRRADSAITKSESAEDGK